MINNEGKAPRHLAAIRLCGLAWGGPANRNLLAGSTRRKEIAGVYVRNMFMPLRSALLAM